MSRVRRNHLSRTVYEEPEIQLEEALEDESEEDIPEVFSEELSDEPAEEPAEEPAAGPEENSASQEYDERIEKRRRAIRKKIVRRKRRTIALMVLIFAMLLTMCSREILRLQAENRALKKQHAQLEQERDRLTKELSNVGDKEYIKEQARKQLKLLDPGEIMFIFEDDQKEAGDDQAEEGEEN